LRHLAFRPSGHVRGNGKVSYVFMNEKKEMELR